MKRYCIGRTQSEIIDYLKKNAEKNRNNIHLDRLVNLCVNFDALTPKNTIALRKFIVDCGADYDIVKGYGGRDETIVIVFNPAKIKKVIPVKSSEVGLSDYERTTDENL